MTDILSFSLAPIEVRNLALIEATERGDVDGARFALAANADIHVEDDMPLYEATAAGNPRLVDLFLNFYTTPIDHLIVELHAVNARKYSELEPTGGRHKMTSTINTQCCVSGLYSVIPPLAADCRKEIVWLYKRALERPMRDTPLRLILSHNPVIRRPASAYNPQLG